MANYGNANVVANLAALGSNFISTTGNIIGGYLIGNGSQLTGIVANYGNANVVANLSALGSNPISTSGSITTSATVSGGSITTSGAVSAVSVSASGNITGGNLRTAGQVSAGGNITGSYFIGNGSLLTGLPATYGNANVVANIAALGSNPVSTTGNITAANFVSNNKVAMLSNVARQTWVANVAPTTVQGNIGDIWYQTV